MDAQTNICLLVNNAAKQFYIVRVDNLDKVKVQDGFALTHFTADRRKSNIFKAQVCFAFIQLGFEYLDLNKRT